MCAKMHIADRVARIAIGGILVVVTLLNAFGPYLSWLIVIIGLMLALTGATGFCPAYKLIGRLSKKEGSCCYSASA
jgi:hypothetical protein